MTAVSDFTLFAEVSPCPQSLDAGRCLRGAKYDGEEQQLVQVTGYHPFVFSVNTLWSAESTGIRAGPLSVALLVLFWFVFVR